MSVPELVYCRFCAEQKSGDQIIDLTKTTSTREDIVEKLSFLNIKWFILSAEHLPQTICNLCYHSLTTAYEFIYRIKTSQTVLTYLFTGNMKQEDNFTHSNEDSRTSLTEELPCTDLELYKHEFKSEVLDSGNLISDGIVPIDLDTSWNSYPWSCRACSMTFNSMSVLREHSKEIHEKCCNFQCADCDAIVNCFDAFIDHVRCHRVTLINFCQYCNMRLEPDTDHVSLHMSQPHCQACGELFQLKTLLQEHNRIYQSLQQEITPTTEIPPPKKISHDVELDNEPENVESWNEYPWICQYCDIRLQDQSSLRSHLKDIHMKCCRMRCFDCYEDGHENFFDYPEFFDHVTKIHRPNLKLYCYYCNHKFQGEDIIHVCVSCSGSQCNVCGDFFQNPMELERHRAISIPSKPKRIPIERSKQPINKESLKCNICYKLFKSRNSLLSHMKLHADRKKYVFCDQCGTSFVSEYNLIEHIKVHTPYIDPETCKICNKSFGNLRNLKRHVRTHDTRKPFECDHCHKCFRIKSELKRHMIFHIDSFPFRCQHCEKKFKVKGLYKNHLLCHTGVKRYSCSDCSKEFTNWSNCNKHMKRIHGTTLVKDKSNPENNIMDEDTKKWTEQILKPRKKVGRKRSLAAEVLVDHRTRIVELRAEGHAIRDISRLLNVSRNTVRRWIRRRDEETKLDQ